MMRAAWILGGLLVMQAIGLAALFHGLWQIHPGLAETAAGLLCVHLSLSKLHKIQQIARMNRRTREGPGGR